MAADSTSDGGALGGGAEGDRLRLAPGVFVRREALLVRAVRSGGPGGQNVNKRSTKIELRVPIDEIPVGVGARRRLERLAGARLTEGGEIVIRCDESRTQKRNREAAIARLCELVARAIVPPKPRKATRPTLGSVRRRLDAKRQRGEVKRRRRPPDGS